MALPLVASEEEVGQVRTLPGVPLDNARAEASAVSWGAILAGAAAAAALSLILLILGTGLGLSTVSPWAHSGIGAATFGVSTILWVTFTQLVASGMGGFLAGRLRTRWLNVHTDEVYFRDTAHGFLAWAVASLATAALLTSVIGSIVSTGIQAGSDIAKSEKDNGPMAYYMDSLFRRDMVSGTAVSTLAARGATAADTVVDGAAAPLSEVTRIFMHAIRTGPLPVDDLRYVGQLVAQRTGLTQQVAEKRVGDTYLSLQAKLGELETATKDAAEKTRKASAYAALWLFISLLIGAFFASLAATYGGRLRDA